MIRIFHISISCFFPISIELSNANNMKKTINVHFQLQGFFSYPHPLLFKSNPLIPFPLLYRI